jgi:hypothetical protein
MIIIRGRLFYFIMPLLFFENCRKKKRNNYRVVFGTPAAGLFT